MNIVSDSPQSAWSRIIALGEQLVALQDLQQQQALIVETARSLFHALPSLWLDNRLFRLPRTDIHFAQLSPEGPDALMQRALQAEKSPYIVTDDLIVSIALRTQKATVGAITLKRPNGPPWSQEELDLLSMFAAHTALALYSAHRFIVEQWRLEQLTLVRTVSAQLVNILDLKSLARRVSRLILETFHYYYVAIFTLEPGSEYLSFLSSASAQEKRGVRSARLTRIRPGEGLIGTVALTGEEIVSNNVDQEPRFRFIERLPGTRSEVVLPLKIESHILGVLDIQSDQENAFHPNDLLVLRSLADTIAVAINHIRLYADLKRRAEQLDIVAAVSEQIVTVLDLDELLQKIADIIQERLRVPYVHLFTVHLNRRRIIYEAGSGARSHAFRGYSISLDHSQGLIPWVARHGESVLANDVRLEPRYRPSPFPPDDTRSELTIPLKYNQQVIGVLDLQSNRKNAFDEDDRFVLEALADTIALSIRNAELFRTERWRRQVTDSLREVAGRLAAMTTVDDVLDAILRELERNLPCDVSAVWLLDGDELYPAHVHGADLLDIQAAILRWPESLQTLYEILKSPVPVIRKPTDSFGPLGLALGFPADHSSIGVALRVGERALGLLVLSHRTFGRYGHEAQALTATFASYAAVAIENARLYDTTQEQAYASAALLQAAQTVSYTHL
ncbi:MAG: GAF domain-containing protein, partial [Anaerolineales bacterium]|nr:GAF domain-containing protein [Anaerolineales bacterium]